MKFKRAFDVCAGREFRLEPPFCLVTRRVVLLLLAILCLASTTDRVSAQVRVTAMWKDNQALKSTEEVKCIHYADWKEENVYVDMVLQPWDELSCPSGLVTIELTAPNGSRFNGSENFRIILQPPRDKDLVIKVSSGNGDLQASAGGEMSAGEVGIVVIKTEYAVRVRRTKEGPVQEFIVFEGAVEVISPTPQFIFRRPRRYTARLGGTSVSAGQKVVLDSSAFPFPAIKKIDGEDIAKSASVYAKIDTAKAMMRKKVDPYETYANLAGRYTAVFSDPTNANKRIQLAVDQVNLDVNRDAFYQLQKAEQFTPPEQNRTRATIAVTRGAAFAQTGDTEAAKKEIQKARVLDASILEEENLRTFRFNEKTRTEILQYKLIAVVPSKGGATRRSAWPIPRNLSSQQQQIFKMISVGRFEEARKAVLGSSNRPDGSTSSIDAYANAIIFYELKDTKNANDAAGFALKQSSVDKLLPKDAYAAAQKILEVTRWQ